MIASETAIDTTQLPPQLRVLVQVIGLSEAIALVQARGGTVLRIPMTASPNCVLLDCIALETLQTLVNVWGNQVIQLPKYDKIAQQLRNQAIQAERQQYSLRQLALKHNLTRRQIINISKASMDSQQRDLFE